MYKLMLRLRLGLWFISAFRVKDKDKDRVRFWIRVQDNARFKLWVRNTSKYMFWLGLELGFTVKVMVRIRVRV